MRKTVFLNVAAITVIAVAFVACSDSSASEKKRSRAMTETEKIQRGAYLVNAIGCDDCHSPKKITATGFEIIPELRLSGYQSANASPKADSNVVKQGWLLFGSDLTTAVGPWGQSFAANLTSDATGIGNWKEEQFIKALREGKYKGLDNTRPLLPPMPWFVYKNLNDDDLKSIFAFLKSTAPVKNVVPAPKPLNTL
ncbi:MAG TPA: diheme cytochrome c-553 [Chitinophagaceae bacterium]|nr:diheme cytochrome c-553 [Chitinophagaceae bacterium]